MGGQFLRALAEAVDRIQAMPTAFPAVHREFRRCKVGRYPVAVFFEIRDD